MTRYPEHEKLSRVSEDSQTTGEFLDWLCSIHDVDLPKPIRTLLSDYFEIDQEKLEQEKSHMLKVQHRFNVLADIDKEDQ